MLNRNPAPIETKDAGDGEDEEGLTAAVAKLTETSAAALEKIAGDVKTIASRQDEIEKKANRLRLAGGSQDAETADNDVTLKKFRLAVGSYVRTGNDKELQEFFAAEQKEHSVGNDPGGGYFVSPVVSSTMTQRLRDQSPMRALSRVETIVAGDSFEEPIDVNDVGGEWVGETQSRPETATADVGLLRIPVHEIYALQPVTQRLLDDVSFDLGAWVEGKIADKFGRSEGATFVTGDGIRKPRGFLTVATDTAGDDTRAWGKLQYVISSAATSIVADALRDLYWALRAPHRKNATWLMASATANRIDKLKDGNGDYIWRNGMTAGAPPSLLGRPVEFDENMPAVDAGAIPIAFGDWQRDYLIVDKAGIKMLRDPFTAKPKVLFYAYRRVGGGIANSDAIKLMKISA